MLVKRRSAAYLSASAVLFILANQARLATALALGQGRLNEVINGRRHVTHLGVLERLADGLTMPDDARVLFGLAPVHAATLTGHAEIAGQDDVGRGDLV
jgi:hypothetical protein